MENVGFIGLGKMGIPMIKNIQKAGYNVIVFNRSKEKYNLLGDIEFKIAKTPREVAENSKVTITMLTDSEAVRSLFQGPDGILSGLGPGKIYIDMSTISPIVTEEIAKMVEGKGAEFLDAPVTGSVPAAEKGELTIMVGGKLDTFEKAKKIFSAMGKNIIYIGPIGSGIKMKMINNIILGVNMLILSEAIKFGEFLGINPEIQIKVLSTGSASSKVLELKKNNILKNEFEPLFNLEHERKDISYATELARRLTFPLILTPLAEQVYTMGVNAGLGKLDFSAIYRLLSNLMDKS